MPPALFMAYIAYLTCQKRCVRYVRRVDERPTITIKRLAMFGFNTELIFNVLHRLLTSNRNTSRPHSILLSIAVIDSVICLFPVALSQFR